MLKNKNVIIFDMDGTLIDSVGIWNEVDLKLIEKINRDAAGFDLCEEGVQADRDAALRRFSKAKNPYMEYCTWLGEKYKSTLTAEKIHTLRYEIAQDYLQNVIDYKKDVDTFIRAIKASGRALVIASTTKRSNMEIYRALNRNIRGKANIDDYFTLVYTREDAKEIKPNPEIYLRVMDELGVAAEECLVFEDSLIGVEAAKAAGIEVAVVYDKYSAGDRDQINVLADYQVNRFSELMKEIER